MIDISTLNYTLVKLLLWLLGSQVDAITISAAKNIQYVFKKLVCLLFFVKGVFDIYLNKSLHTWVDQKVMRLAS